MKKTILILGAGASKDFCRIFPTGLELIKDINYHFLTELKSPEVPESDGIYLSALMNDLVRAFGNNIKLFKEIKNKLWKIQLAYEWKALRNKNSDQISIDNFIATNVRSGNLNPLASEIIKYSIYYIIKGAEEAYVEGEYNQYDNWIYDLVRKLNKYDIENIADNLKIISFNYDRIFEEYFMRFLLEEREVSTLDFEKIYGNIYHVYNSLGSLAEVSFTSSNKEAISIRQNYKRLKLIDERENNRPEIKHAAEFENLHFLGFGYDKTNISLLDLDTFSNAKLSGTAFYFSKSQISEIKDTYNIETIDANCRKYLETIDL